MINHIVGKLYGNENVIAIIYGGKNAIQKIRDTVGKANSDECEPSQIRGKYGKIHSKTGCFETGIHASDSKESAKNEIKLWFDDCEIVE